MTPHLSEEQVVLYRGRALAAAELLRASEHIAECEICRKRITSPGEVDAGVAAMHAVLGAEAAESGHLEYHEIAAYVDRQLPDDEAVQVEMHARECTSCAATLDEIEALRREIEVGETSPGWFQHILRFWREALGWKGSFLLAGAAACAVLVLLVVRHPAARTQPPSQTAEIKDGKRVIAIRAGGAVTGLDDFPPADRAVLARAITTQQIELPAALADLAGKRGVLLGASTPASGVGLLGPLGVVVETERPVFTWKPLAGVEYRVSIYGENYQQAAASGWIRAAEWQVLRPLQRGARYSWQLNVRGQGAEFTVPSPPAPEARFRVLSGPEEAGIAQLKASGRDSHLLLGIRYAQAGVLDDAELELRAAREQNPQSSAVAALLASVEQMRSPKP